MAQNFIGLEALEHIARTITPEVAMSAYYNRQAVFEKFGIKVISGLGFKDVKYVLLRKGHTTRRKAIGDSIESLAGKLIDRTLTTYLAWNRYRSNKKMYREIPVMGDNGEYYYPNSEFEMRAALANYADDVYDCFWHGDASIGNGEEQGWLGLYDGVFTNINKDVAAGIVKPIHLSGTIAPPASTTDTQAYQLFKEFRSKWDVHLQAAARVIVAMSSDTAEAIADAYGNSKNNNKEVILLPNGNFKFPQWPNTEIAHDPTVGVGTKMIAYIPENVEYGIDTENPENQIAIQLGSDRDADDIFFQPQTAQGTRVYNPTPSALAVTDASIAPLGISGDFQKGTISVTSNNTSLGTVTVDGATPDPEKAYERGTNVVLKATATGTGKFVKWSNGMTDAQITVIASGCPDAYVAIFAANS